MYFPNRRCCPDIVCLACKGSRAYVGTGAAPTPRAAPRGVCLSCVCLFGNVSFAGNVGAVAWICSQRFIPFTVGWRTGCVIHCVLWVLRKKRDRVSAVSKFVIIDLSRYAVVGSSEGKSPPLRASSCLGFCSASGFAILSLAASSSFLFHSSLFVGTKVPAQIL